MSGHADYSKFLDKIPDNIIIYEVPIIKATTQTIKEYGKFVDNFGNEKVINTMKQKIVEF